MKNKRIEREEKSKEDEELEELLSPTRSIDLKILKELEGLPKHFTTLLLLEPTSYSRIDIQLLKYMIKTSSSRGIYVTMNKSFYHLTEILQGEKIDTSKIQFIDGITRGTGRKEIPAKNCVYIEAPHDLVGINVAINECLEKIGDDNGFLIFDSISTLLIYNSPESVEKFVHAIIGKIRESKVRAVFLMVKSEQHRGVIDALSQFCDKTFEIS
jgi:KaiC/GvpD/RAD55 family RecA-like ATPase